MPWRSTGRWDVLKGASRSCGHKPDNTHLEEHREAFEEEFGEEVSTSTLGRAIASLPDGGWPLKKVTDSLRARRASQRFVAVAG